ncbi:MAG: CHAT domain-containing protein [Acidobacteriota bacterium]|nr:CHAT domain-containing protein [Acidobacteriota bacterium]
MRIKLYDTKDFFEFLNLKIVGLVLLCHIGLLCVAGQELSKAANSQCGALRLAVGQGNYEEAVRLVDACLESGAKNHPAEYAENLLLGAEIEFYLGNNAQASKYAAFAEKQHASLEGKNQKGLWLFSIKLKKILAALEVEAGTFQSALKFYKEGLTILAAAGKSVVNDGGELRRLKADLLSGVSFVQLKTGLYSEAITNLEAALTTLDDSPLDNYSRPFILNDFGHLLNEQRSHRQAISYLEKATQIWQQQKDWRNYAMSQQNLAVAYRGTGDFKQAQSFFERVQELAVKNNFDDLKTMSLQGLASLHQVRGENKLAVEVLQKALGQTSAASVRRAEILWRLSTNQIQAGEGAMARAGATECYEWATAQKIENLRYLCATNLGDTFLQNSPATAEKWFQTAVEITEGLSLRVAGKEAEKIYFMQDKWAAYHALIKMFVQANKPEQAFAVGEKLKSRVLREKLQNRASKVLGDDVSNRTSNLSADTVVISYVLTDVECFAFLLKAGDPPKIIMLPVVATELREQIGRYRKSILSFNPTFKAEARQLYDLLLKAAEGGISKAKRLIIVPDGALWELPFQALINSGSGKYLIEEREISYAPSLGVLFGMKSQAASKINRKNLVAFANSTRKDSAPLPEAEREANDIGKLYAPASIFVKTAATEKRVKTEASQAKVLHLAVHGEFDQTDPFESALLFTQEAGDDGRLTVSEILLMNLPDSLVVLSSCDTSNGQVINGEGLLSLSWAFLASGGQSVVAAQWAVEEKATADLMLNFHRAVRSNGNEAANALREAQLEALKRPAPYNHPFYWSAFVSVEGPQR